MFAVDPTAVPALGPVDRLQRLIDQRQPSTRWGGYAWMIARYAAALLRDLLGGEISLRAMSLVYTTLLP